MIDKKTHVTPFYIRFVEWSYYKGCPIEYMNDKGEWEDMPKKKFIFKWNENTYRVKPRFFEHFKHIYTQGGN